MKIEVQEDGTVWQEGRRIGEIRDATAWLEAKPGAALKTAVKKAAGRKDLGFAVAVAATAKLEEAKPMAPPNQMPDFTKPDPEPKQDPRKGQKDPVWLAWKARQGRKGVK